MVYKKDTSTLKQYSSQKGQVLLFVVITMTIALALGVGLSLETISSISNVADTDSSQRALAAAEGAAERLLTLTSEELDQVKSGNCLNVGTSLPNNKCLVSFESEADNPLDVIDIEVEVEVDDYDMNIYNTFFIAKNQVREVSVEGYTSDSIDVCWNGESVLYLGVYNDIGQTQKSLILCDAASGTCDQGWTLSGAISSGIPSPTPIQQTFQSCTKMSGLSSLGSLRGLRIRSLGNGSQVGIFPSSVLPSQGYLIRAVGKLKDAPELQRKVTVLKSIEFTPSIFDFGIYSEGSLGL